MKNYRTQEGYKTLKFLDIFIIVKQQTINRNNKTWSSFQSHKLKMKRYIFNTSNIKIKNIKTYIL